MAEGGGAPKWMATFADLMSLLLAFFVLLFSFSSVDDQKYHKVGGSMKEAFGVQRRVEVMDQVKGINFIATEYSSAPADPRQLNVVPQENLDIDRVYEEVEQPEKGGQEGTKGTGATESSASSSETEVVDIAKMMESAQANSAAADDVSVEDAKQAALDYIQEKLDEELLKGELDVELDGDHIIINISEESSFEKGSVNVKQPFKGLMEKISAALGDVEGEVQIAGHTDNEPITSSRFRSNWELSASRAVTVLQGLRSYTNIKPENFVIMGHGDTRPKASNDTVAGRAQNRRVEVKLRYDAVQIKRRQRATSKEDPDADYEGFDSSLQELEKSVPIGKNDETVLDIIMQGFN